MADNAIGNSKSKRRRRGNRKKSKKNKPESVSAVQESVDNYRVESPKTVKKNGAATVVKSRSLDSEEMLKITELSECESDDKNIECNAIVAEADSDIEWEVTEELKMSQITESKPSTSRISPEEENNLRSFLEGIDLVTSPQVAAKVVQEKMTLENARMKRMKKRDQLVQYFTPVYQNPRYLEAISEESSDSSEKEAPLLIKIIEKPPTELIEDICSMEIVNSSVAELVNLDETSDDTTESEEYVDAESIINTSDENKLSDYVPASQLTPPPTPDSATPENERESIDRNTLINEASFKREFKEIFHEQECMANNDNRSPSACSESSSSDSIGTTQCTALYNPMVSSIGDVNSLLKDIENIKDFSKSFQPLTLKEICLQRLVSLPFGPDVLEELAEVSQSLEEFTNKLPTAQFHIPHDQSFINIDTSKDTNTIFTVPVKNSNESWVSLPTEQDPKTCICLSPTQKDFLESKQQIKHEADTLLDLHEKFINRKGYNENMSNNKENEIVITSIKTDKHGTNRLLDIIRNNSNSKDSGNNIEECNEDKIKIPVRAHKELSQNNSIEDNSASSGNIFEDFNELMMKSKHLIPHSIPIKLEEKNMLHIIDNIFEESKETTTSSTSFKKSCVQKKIDDEKITSQSTENTSNEFQETKNTIYSNIDSVSNKPSVNKKPTEHYIKIDIVTDDDDKQAKHKSDKFDNILIKSKENLVNDKKISKVSEFFEHKEKNTINDSLIETKISSKNAIYKDICESNIKPDGISNKVFSEFPEDSEKHNIVEKKNSAKSTVYNEISKSNFKPEVPIRSNASKGRDKIHSDILKEMNLTSESQYKNDTNHPLSNTETRITHNQSSIDKKITESSGKDFKESSEIIMESKKILEECNNLMTKSENMSTITIENNKTPTTTFRSNKVQFDKSNDIMNNKYMTLPIIKENKTLTTSDYKTISHSTGNIFEDCNYDDMKRCKSMILPSIQELAEEARLKAKSLTEWLQLARNKRDLYANIVGPRNNLERSPHEATSNQNRRRSLPHEFYIRQMQYIIDKEKQIQQEIEYLEDEKRKLTSQMYTGPVPLDDYVISKNGDYAIHNNEFIKKQRPKSMPVEDPTEKFRQEMYDEYMKQVAAREDRKHHKVIKISLHNEETIEEKHETQTTNAIENEFMDKVKKRMDKFGLQRDDSRERSDHEDDKKPILIMDGDAITKARKLPKHIQEFVDITHQPHDGVWSPGQKQNFNPEELNREVSHESSTKENKSDETIQPIWTPRSAGSSPTTERKEFRPVNFESPVLSRKARTKSDGSANLSQTKSPWKAASSSSETVTVEKRLPTSFSAPGPGFSDIQSTSRLPKAQNPTITLLQKAREGQIPKSAAYIEQERHRRQNESPFASSDLVRTENISDSESEQRPRRIINTPPVKYEGIGPTTKDGMPLVLRSEIRDANMSQWYKKMYDTIHKQKPGRYNDDEYVMVRYKQRRGRYPYSTGYLSEPEPGAYDSDATLSDNKFATLDRRRPTGNKENEYMSSTLPRNAMSTTTISYKTSDVQHNPDSFKNQPGRIENYTPGTSSISDKEAKQWWDEVMDIFDGHLEQQKRMPQTKGYMSQALKESGYESDSTLVFRRRDDTAQQLSPLEQREVYKNIQKGGDVPLHGLRKLAPERPKDDVEYFPITSTLNRIRVHKSAKPRGEYFSYRRNVPPNPPPQVFATFKRSAPSTLTNVTTLRKAPSPPRRKSSRNNSTLRLISTMKIHSDKSCKRHETCFASTSTIDKSNVKYLRDKITCKLSPQTTRRGETRLKVTKSISTSDKPKIATIKSTRPLISRRCCNKQTKPCRFCSLSVPRKPERISSLSKERPASLERTFGTIKKTIDKRIKPIKSSELKSPTDVKKAVINQINNLNGSSPKSSSTILSAFKNKQVKPKIDRTKSSSSYNITKPRARSAISPVPSTLSEKSRSSNSTSMDSLRSGTKPSSKIIKPITPKDKKLKKSKKEQLNVELVKETKKIKNKKEDTITKITPEDIHRQKDLVKTDTFFQNLYLRDLSPPPMQTHWLHEKTQALYKRKPSYSEPGFGALKIYLNHTKPVTDSKFKSLDMVIRSRSASPKSVTWKKNDDNIYYSDRERSISLPPKLAKSRPSTPVMGRKQMKIYPNSEETLSRLLNQRSPSPSGSERLYFSETSRPVSPFVERRFEPEKREFVKRKQPDKIIFSETSRPVSPIIDRLYYPPIPSSPKILRSPSCRKIKSRQIDSRNKSLRALSTVNTDKDMYHSTSSLESFDSLIPNNSNRFKELNQFYSDLERLDELERTTSTSDLRPRKRFEEEIIDFDRWTEVRTRERAERELRDLYKHLRDKEKDKSFLFRPKDISTIRWNREMDRGLRIKEKSVENIKEDFEKIRKDEFDKEARLKQELIYKRGVYKPLWRGNSVVNLAHTLNERRSQSEGRVSAAKQKIIDSEKMLTHGIGSRVWSSLSMEQVNILKNQLSEIYSNDMKFQKTKSRPDYGIDVSLDTDPPPSNLKVRRNSDSPKTSPLMDRKLERLSEVDKKKLSQSLSKEVLERQRQKYKTSLSLVLGKETRGAIAAADANITELPSPRTCYSLEMSEDDKDQTSKENDFVLVLTKNDSDAYKNNINETLEIWAQPKNPLIKTDAVSKPTSISETESGSTDGSIKTVIFAGGGSKEKIQDKVEFFENISDREVYTPTIHKPADIDEPGDSLTFTQQNDGKLTHEKRYLSQSQQDFKELFGEREMNKFTTEPLSASRKIDYSSPTFPKLRTSHVYRSRSLSPYYDESYASLKAGDVCRLKNKFEDYYCHRFKLKPRRCNSDPQLNKKVHIPGQQNGDVDSLRMQFEYPLRVGRGRSRYRRGGIVSPIALRAEDRFMPHINIISKIATLYPRKSSPSPEKFRSSEDLAKILGIPIGEVEKLRQRFDSPEKMSILGHMFTSSPNIHELRDVAQYLTGSWTAHRYPKTEDNTRPLSPKNTKHPRPKSTSPIRSKTKLSSILKSNQRRQHFDPELHRPVARYQPPPPKTETLKYRSWWSSTPHRPSVTFKEPEDPPPPPPKGQYDITDSNPESPRKYVENEVTIHYRTPVRQEIKEALSEDELAKRQAEAMRKIYEEERRRKYLQVSHSDNELHDMNSRRHTDNFIPSQKSPIPLNRYDDFLDDLSPRIKPRPRSPEPRLVARALYNFVGQTARELTFKKGDVIYIRRQVDKNWYEGEINAMIGLFPANYVEIVPYDGMKSTPRKAHEGQARAKYNFIAQTHLELSLAKGELVVITRRVDDNWFEGKIGGRKGIFPVSYVEVLVDPSDPPPGTPTTKPVAAPASHSLLLNGSSGGKESMGTHNYVPTFPTQDLGMSYRAKPIQISSSGTYGSLKKNPVDQALHIDTQSEPIPYRALYKYRPQNEDELELLEGDTVYVLEKCDDGWYVGSSDRTGAFGTFPGNYVERI